VPKGPEAALEAKVIQLARMYGWLLMHPRAAYQPGAGKWLTPLSGDAGYPDLTMVRGTRVIFAELKSDKGRLQPNQKVWLDRLEVVSAEAPGVM